MSLPTGSVHRVPRWSLISCVNEIGLVIGEVSFLIFPVWEDCEGQARRWRPPSSRSFGSLMSYQKREPRKPSPCIVGMTKRAAFEEARVLEDD